MKTLFCFLFLFFCSSSFAADLYSEVYYKINAIRKQHGLVTLSHNNQLQSAAQSQSDWMAKVQRMDHLRDYPSSFEEYKVSNYHPANRVINSGYFKFEDLFSVRTGQTGVAIDPLPAANENVSEIIAMGRSADSKAYNTNIIVQGWMRSPGHKKVILTPNFKEMGIGISSIRTGEVYWCVVFANR